jgi:hypothetical protein
MEKTDRRLDRQGRAAAEIVGELKWLCEPKTSFPGDATVCSFSVRLTPLFVAAALLCSTLSASAQFGAVGGIAAPSVLPAPVFNAGGAFPGGLGFGLGYGAGLGYGLGGWGTQWMQNPYEGYLNGAANLTTANAQYQLTIQQARQAREEARRSALETRRQTLLEREWERSLQPDPEQIRQQQLMKSLQRSRNNPPSTEIWSGTALNDLVRGIQTAQTSGASGSDVPLSPEVLKHINVTTGTTYGGVGLLRDDGKLTWPYSLSQSDFDNPRKELDELLPEAIKEARSGRVSPELLNKIRSEQTKLSRILDAQAANLTPSDFTEASRYLRELKDSVRVLQQTDVAKYFRPAWTPKGATVGELVQQMTREGLRFAPAVSGDESYYTTLHRALVDYDMSVSQLTAMQARPGS